MEEFEGPTSEVQISSGLKWSTPQIEDRGKPKGRPRVFLEDDCKRFTLALPADQYARLKAVAEFEGCSVTDIARQAIYRFCLEKRKAMTRACG